MGHILCSLNSTLQDDAALYFPLENHGEDLVSPLMKDIETEITKEIERERMATIKSTKVCLQSHICMHANLA